MAQKDYTVGGRTFRTEGDYKRALRDMETIERLRKESEFYSISELEALKKSVRDGKYPFYTLLGQDFEDELADRMKEAGKPKVSKPVTVSDEAVLLEYKRSEKRRKVVILFSMIAAMLCLTYFALYIYYGNRTQNDYDELIALKNQNDHSPLSVPNDEKVEIHYSEETNQIEAVVLDEYKNLLNKNKMLIGWVKIDDTYIDYPVMQTSDNDYYLDHNMNQEYDKNGSIFMDKDCDVLKPSTNFILYGHHMRSGKMFGGLDKYSDPNYYEKHKYIQFDTIYEKGLYEVMYVFRSRVYSETDVVFKYYQFIDANSEVEFASNMTEMANASLYDTGVTAKYGDRLLTLSTCDYKEPNGRFVVVAKKVTKKE